jgi:hypothetical protein
LKIAIKENYCSFNYRGMRGLSSRRFFFPLLFTLHMERTGYYGVGASMTFPKHSQMEFICYSRGDECRCSDPLLWILLPYQHWEATPANYFSSFPSLKPLSVSPHRLRYLPVCSYLTARSIQSCLVAMMTIGRCSKSTHSLVRGEEVFSRL